MAAAAETTAPPFTAFNFEVVLTLVEPLPGVGQPVCRGAFSECDGIALEMEAKTVVQGGFNDSVTHLIGQTRPGQLTLRRGMTSTPDVWAWVAAAGTPGRDVSADGEITMYDARHELQARFIVSGCFPTRARGAGLNAQNGMLAIEELGLAVGHLALEGTGPAAGIGIGFSAGFDASFSAGASVGFGAGGGAQVSGGFGLTGQLGGTFSAGASASASAGASAGFG